MKAFDCRHFNGIQHRTCKAGVLYSEVREKPASGPYKFPCLNEGGNCGMFDPFTKAEADARDREIEARFKQIIVARAAILNEGKRSGEIACPACEIGKLGFSIASNGHVHARCSTAKCLSWME